MPNTVIIMKKALYNHILASQNPETGMTTYYLPLVAGSKRGYSSAFETFTCCVGTGFENHARYGEAIYFKDKKNNIFVNLYIPSVLTWQEKGITLKQEGNYERDGNIRITVTPSKSEKFSMLLQFLIGRRRKQK